MINESQNKQNESNQDSANVLSDVDKLDSKNQGESSASRDEALDLAESASRMHLKIICSLTLKKNQSVCHLLLVRK